MHDKSCHVSGLNRSVSEKLDLLPSHLTTGRIGGRIPEPDWLSIWEHKPNSVTYFCTWTVTWIWIKLVRRLSHPREPNPLSSLFQGILIFMWYYAIVRMALIFYLYELLWSKFTLHVSLLTEVLSELETLWNCSSESFLFTYRTMLPIFRSTFASL